MTRYELPARFYQDHTDRDLPGGTVVGKRRNLLIVEMTDAEAADLLDDAVHYVQSGTLVYGIENLGLVSSARATMKRLAAAGITEDSGTVKAKPKGRPEVGDRVLVRDFFTGIETEHTVVRVCPSCAEVEDGSHFDLHFGEYWRPAN